MTCVTAQFQHVFFFCGFYHYKKCQQRIEYILQIFIGIENEFDGHLRKQQFQSDKCLKFMGHLEDLFFLNIHTICCRCIKYNTFCMGDVVNSVYCRKRKNWTVCFHNYVY